MFYILKLKEQIDLAVSSLIATKDITDVEL